MSKKPKERATDDHVTAALVNLGGGLPAPRICTTDREKMELIRACGGPRTARSIRKSMKTSPLSRIPHLFSSIDTQVVVDLLHNDVDSLIDSMIPAKK